MMQKPKCCQNNGIDWGEGMRPDVLPSVIDIPESKFASKCMGNENIETNLIKGVPAAPGVAVGPAAVIQTSEDLQRIAPNSILICPCMSPELSIVFSLIGGIISERGGVMSTAATIARENGLPVVTAIGPAAKAIFDGDLVSIDGTDGSVQILSKTTALSHVI
jgi:pyruvate,water dikinase